MHPGSGPWSRPFSQGSITNCLANLAPAAPNSVVTPLHGVQREHIYTHANGTPTRKVTVSYSPGGDKSVLQYGLAGNRWELKADKGPIVPYRLPHHLKYSSQGKLDRDEGVRKNV